MCSDFCRVIWPNGMFGVGFGGEDCCRNSWKVYYDDRLDKRCWSDFTSKKCVTKSRCFVQYHDISTPIKSEHVDIDVYVWDNTIYFSGSFFFRTRLSWVFFLECLRWFLFAWLRCCVELSIASHGGTHRWWHDEKWSWVGGGGGGGEAFLGGWDPNLVRATLTYSLYNPYITGSYLPFTNPKKKGMPMDGFWVFNNSRALGMYNWSPCLFTT